MLDLAPIKKRLAEPGQPDRTTIKQGCVPDLVAEIERLRTALEATKRHLIDHFQTPVGPVVRIIDTALVTSDSGEEKAE